MNRIKGEDMTNEEKLIIDIKNHNMAELVDKIKCPRTKPKDRDYCLQTSCKDCIEEWLKQSC